MKQQLTNLKKAVEDVLSAMGEKQQQSKWDKINANADRICAELDKRYEDAPPLKECIIGRRYRVISGGEEKGEEAICEGKNGSNYYDFKGLNYYYTSSEVELIEEPATLPYNAWYKHKDSTEIMVYFTSENEGWGIGLDGDWYKNDRWHPLNSGDWIPATNQERDDAIFAYARKLGFKAGVKVKRPSGWVDLEGDKLETLTKPLTGDEFNIDEVGLSCSGTYIMIDGIWAEIIEDEKIEIGGREVVFDAGTVTVNKHRYTKDEVLAVKTCLDLGFEVMVGCNNHISLDSHTITKILERL